MKLIRATAAFIFLTGLNAASMVNESSVAIQLRDELAQYLSGPGLISTDAPPRWNTLGAPTPGAVVNVQTELDVAITVKYCTAKGIPFLAQNGGSGWAIPFNLTRNGVLINLGGLNQVTFNADKTEATIGGGSNISNTIAHAYAAGALVVTENCNCVGTLGALLGGGYGNLVGLYGLGVDNVVSLNVVTADGRLRNVTATSDPDLFWSLRGAGPNFGIVTSAVVKSHPATESDMRAWTGFLIFDTTKLEMVVQAIQDLQLQPDMNVFMYFLSTGPPTNEPAIVVTPFLYKGNETSGRAAFASLYSIDPKTDTTSVLPYTQWNSGADGFCTFRSRKPSYGAGFQRTKPTTWRQVWNKYVDFQKKPTAENSIVLLEAYSLIKARSLDLDSAAFPFRTVNFNVVAIPWYDERSLDGEAEAFGVAARDLWRSTDGLAQNSTYVNFAHGDETPEIVYGRSLPRLQAMKQQFDPHGWFNQWFNILREQCD
ncbi:hypothetical protein O1611_g2849 [Lasiodiplodia mahajangana]|uniref:Uncharacterized protein n=1 Tax=Lasiodiplodia mahajangana TaxID=1108764 RepID=A0ACC2JUB4_9PEZI|nr:hypothetical protein O1611_g2849 [Lasiodiplodia mahajangana]